MAGSRKCDTNPTSGKSSSSQISHFCWILWHFVYVYWMYPECYLSGIPSVYVTRGITDIVGYAARGYDFCLTSSGVWTRAIRSYHFIFAASFGVCASLHSRGSNKFYDIRCVCVCVLFYYLFIQLTVFMAATLALTTWASGMTTTLWGIRQFFFLLLFIEMQI